MLTGTAPPNGSIARPFARVPWPAYSGCNLGEILRDPARGQNFESFTASVHVQSAVERQFEVIGESLKHLSKVAPDIASTIPDCGQIIAFRNMLVHGYAVLDKAIARQIVKSCVHSKLRRSAKTRLEKLDRITQRPETMSRRACICGELVVEDMLKRQPLRA